MPSADSGVGSSPTSFLNSLWNSESAAILRNASRKISARSFGVAGGKINGEPTKRRERKRVMALRSRSVLARSDISGRCLNCGCLSPLGGWKSVPLSARQLTRTGGRAHQAGLHKTRLIHASPPELPGGRWFPSRPPIPQLSEDLASGYTLHNSVAQGA